MTAISSDRATEIQYVCDDTGQTVSVIVPIEVWKRITSQQVESLVVEGLDSGEPIEVTEEWWNAKRDRLLEKLDGDSQ